MGRISLPVRLVLIVAGALFLLQMVALAVQLSRDDGLTLGGIRPSFAREVAGLVRLFDRLPPRRQALALEFLNSGRFSVELVQDAPAHQDRGVLLRFTASSIARRIADEGIPARRLDVSYLPNSLDTNAERGPLANLFGSHMRITVALKDNGGYLVIVPDSEVDSFVFGSILTVAGGIFGLIVLLGAVLAVLRETRPLKTLAASVDAFGKSAIPVELEERGAPELRTLIRATNAMQRQIAALLKNRALILAGLSHDLRTQVTRLRLRLELLDEGETRNKAITDVEAMQALIEETLAFASASSSADGGRTDVAKLLDTIAAQSPDTVHWSGHPPLVLAIGETPLRRLLDNLIQNAIKYGHTADVTVSTTAATATIAIADRGPGIPPSEREMIFEPFYRLETSRSREHGGTGLGLAIVRQILDRHSGTVTITDRAGGGSIFTVTLPLAAAV